VAAEGWAARAPGTPAGTARKLARVEVLRLRPFRWPEDEALALAKKGTVSAVVPLAVLLEAPVLEALVLEARRRGNGSGN